MGSSRGQDQCLGGGISLPQWIKGRGDARYDFDHSSFSPPSHDDNFFCIRYSSKRLDNNASEKEAGGTGAAGGPQQGYRPISELLSENKNSNCTSQPGVSSLSKSSDIANIRDIKNIDFSKHPLPCQPFIPSAAGGKEKSGISSEVGSGGAPVNKARVVKSQGTDDGFHSEPALCGKSIVHVANRMMSKKLNNKIESSKESGGGGGEEDYSNRRTEKYEFKRKGSKSLPVTPIASPTASPESSPKSRRRAVIPNRYFAGSFGADNNKYQAGWLLSSILGQAREGPAITTAGHKIQEVDEELESGVGPGAAGASSVPAKYLSRKKSISSQNLSYVGRASDYQEESTNKSSAPVYTNVLTKTKPSELREMNFWSPTSM